MDYTTTKKGSVEVNHLLHLVCPKDYVGKLRGRNDLGRSIGFSHDSGPAGVRLWWKLCSSEIIGKTARWLKFK